MNMKYKSIQSFTFFIKSVGYLFSQVSMGRKVERKMEKECAKISMKILRAKRLNQKLVTQVERLTNNSKDLLTGS